MGIRETDTKQWQETIEAVLNILIENTIDATEQLKSV